MILNTNDFTKSYIKIFCLGMVSTCSLCHIECVFGVFPEQHNSRTYNQSYVPMNQQPYPVPVKTDSQDLLTMIENQLNAIQNKDYQTAYNNYTSASFRQTTPLDQFVYFITNYPAFNANKNAIFGALDFKNDVASLQGTLTSTTGETIHVEYFLEKDGGLWKILGIKLVNPAAPAAEPQPRAEVPGATRDYYPQNPR
jgi:hypothetical protein